MIAARITLPATRNSTLGFKRKKMRFFKKLLSSSQVARSSSPSMSPRPSCLSDRKLRRVALVVETSVCYGREILKGISSYMHRSCNWSIFLDERELSAPPPDWLLEWKGDGVICRSTTPKIAEAFKKSDLAVIDLNDCHGRIGLPRIASDMRAIGEVAARHLREIGLRHIAFCGFDDRDWSAERCRGVQEGCGASARFLGSFETAFGSLRSHSWDAERKRIATWLHKLPKPVGIVACNDVRAHHVLEACREQGFSVPEEVAVVGVDNSEDFCRLSNPPLSSVVPNAARIGYEAAKALDRMMSGGRPGFREMLIPPIEVAVRRSTENGSAPNNLVGFALRFIRENACSGAGVDEVLDQLKVSRSTLERAFRREIGHSPKEEFRRARLKKVRDLLVETKWPLERIAEEAGFLHPEYMMVQFKRIVGMTPSRYRELQGVRAFD